MSIWKERTAAFIKKLWQTIAGFKFTLSLSLFWMIFLIAEIFMEMYAPADNTAWEAAMQYTLALSNLMVFLAAAVFLCEIRFPGNYIKWGLLCLPSAVLSGICIYIRIWENSILLISEERALGILAGYILLILLFILYSGFQRAKRPFPSYIMTVFIWLMAVGAIWLILLFGLMVISSIISTLLIELPYEWETIILVISTEVCLFPGCIMALIVSEKADTSDENNNPIFRVVIKYLLTGISIGIMGIGYLYMLKILFLREFPSNEIFSAVAALFIIGAPAWLIDENYKEETFYSKFISLLPYLFLPLVVLQSWSLFIRISEYGLTPERCLGIALILFEISFVLIWKLFRKSCEKLLLAAAVLIVLSCLLPFVNIYFLSLKSQQYFLRIYKDRLTSGIELSELEYKRFRGAYRYLNSHGLILSEAEKAQYENLLNDAAEAAEDSETLYSVHGCQMVGTLNTEGFRTLNMLDQNEKYDSLFMDASDIDFSRFSLLKRETGEEVFIDLSPVYEAVLAYTAENPDSDKDADSAFLKQLNCIRLDENSVFYLNHFQVEYYANDDTVTKVKALNIGGMLLTK